MRLKISLIGAEADALAQILGRHAGVLARFEKDQLACITGKVRAARGDARRRESGAWRRFVWTAEDITIIRRGGETADGSGTSDGYCTCECHADGVRPLSAPGGTWCEECSVDRARLLGSSLVAQGEVLPQKQGFGRAP